MDTLIVPLTTYDVNPPLKLFLLGVDAAKKRGYNEARREGGCMRKLVVSAPARQHEYINRVAKETGLPKAEVIRRILDEHIQRTERGFTNDKEN